MKQRRWCVPTQLVHNMMEEGYEYWVRFKDGSEEIVLYAERSWPCNKSIVAIDPNPVISKRS